jgi:nitrogenase-associated protein
MKLVLFYEKPGCSTNAGQKRELQRAGCIVIGRNLLDHGLTPEELLAFLRPLPVEQWFNPNAPKIKNRQIDPGRMTEAAALQLLMAEPILIRRPLMVVSDRKLCGYEPQLLEPLIGRTLAESAPVSCSSTTVAYKN